MEEDRSYYFYYANKESKLFISLSKSYWNWKLDKLSEYLEHELSDPTIILFGSLTKAEAKNDSDIDIAVIAHKREIDVRKYEKSLKRKIQFFFFESIKDIKSKELRNNIVNGYVLTGRISL